MPEQDEVMRMVLDRLTRIETKLDSYNKVKDQVYENQRELLKLTTESKSSDEKTDMRMGAMEDALSKRIQEVEDDLTAFKGKNNGIKNAFISSLISVGVTMLIGILVMAIRYGWIG